MKNKIIYVTETNIYSLSSSTSARGPDEVIERYQKVLKAYKKKNSITAACKIVGVDRNTVALNAPIAELATAAPEKFAEFRDQHTRKHKLCDFAGKCLDAIRDSPDINNTVQTLKGELRSYFKEC